MEAHDATYAHLTHELCIIHHHMHILLMSYVSFIIIVQCHRANTVVVAPTPNHWQSCHNYQSVLPERRRLNAVARAMEQRSPPKVGFYAYI